MYLNKEKEIYFSLAQCNYTKPLFANYLLYFVDSEVNEILG